jgi:hypothetical protein
MNPFTRRFVSQGHLVDSGLLTRRLNLIVEEGGDYEVLTFKLGRTNRDESSLELEVRCAEERDLERLAVKLVALGCYERKPGEAVFRPAPLDGVAPEDFYSTTHHRTEVFVQGRWREASRQRMDAVVVLEEVEPVCRKLRDLRSGQPVLCGSSSVRLSPPERDREPRLFGFMLSEVSSERSVENAVSRVAGELKPIRAAGSLAAAVEKGVLTSGVMYELLRAGVPYALAGSIRDDGPLPETINDMIEAQAAYERLLAGAALVLMLGTMLHSIAVGNMLPSWVKAVCVDIAAPVIIKLADRGSAQTVGIVTDVGLFLRSLAANLIGSS